MIVKTDFDGIGEVCQIMRIYEEKAPLIRFFFMNKVEAPAESVLKYFGELKCPDLTEFEEKFWDKGQQISAL